MARFGMHQVTLKLYAGPDTTVAFTANQDGTGGTRTLGDGTHTTRVNLTGQYQASGFQIATDGSNGRLLSYLTLHLF